MNKWLSNLLANTSEQGRVVFRSSLFVMGVIIFSFPFYIFVFQQTGAWQINGLLSVAMVIILLSLYSAIIAWDDRYQAALELLVSGMGISFLLVIGWFNGFGLLLGISILIFVTTVSSEALTNREAPRTLAIALAFGVTAYLMDIFANWERLSVPIITTYLPYFTAPFILYQAAQIFSKFPNFSIRTKFVTVFVTISLVSILLVAFAANRVFVIQTKQLLSKDIKAISESSARQISSTLEGNLDRLNVLALNKFIQDSVDTANMNSALNAEEFAALDKEWANASPTSPLIRGIIDNEISSEIREFKSKYPHILEVFITDKYGGLLASNVKTSDFYQADEEWWQKAWNDGKGGIYISQPEFDESTGKYSILISMAIPGHARSDIVGVLRSTVELEEFSAILSIGQFGETGHSDLYFPSDQFLSENLDEGLTIALPETLSNLESIRGDFGEIVFEENPSLVSRTLVSPNLPFGSEAIKNLNWYVVTHQDISEANIPIEASTKVISLVSLGLLLAAGILAYFLGSQFTSPLENLTATAAKFSNGDVNAVATVSSKDEFGILANAFNLMGSRLRDLIGTLEQRISDRTRALATASEVSRRLSTILDEKKLANAVVEQVKTAYNYYHGQIYLLDESGQTLVLAGATGEGGAILLNKKHSLSIEKGLVGRAARTKSPVLVPDTSKDPSWMPNPLLPDTKAEIVVPILLGDQLLGVLDMQDDVTGDIYPEDIEYLTAIANQAAIGFQNARSYAKAERKAEREALISSIGQRIQRETTMESALKVAVREVGRALGTGAMIKLKPGKDD